MLDADTAEQRGKAGENVILVRWETTPDDIHGLIQAAGILTAHGGMTSHAAVVARGMGKPCVAGCDALSIDVERAHDHARRPDSFGRRHPDHRRRHRRRDRRRGAARPAAGQRRPRDDARLGRRHRRLNVRANADTPQDAAKAREFGAQGIGLCRTEHMFMAEERLPVVREMILATDESGRRKALDKLLPMQQGDFEGSSRQWPAYR